MLDIMDLCQVLKDVLNWHIVSQSLHNDMNLGDTAKFQK